MKSIFLLILIVFLYFCYKNVEGYSVDTIVDDNIYETCPNTYNNMNNDYKLKLNPIKPSPVGFYSDILESGGARSKRRYLAPPICVKSHEFVPDYWINNKIVDCPALPHGKCDTINSNGSRDLYKNNKEPLIDPFYPYPKVGKNYSIIYPEEEQKKFIELHVENEIESEKLYKEMERIKQHHDNEL